MEREREREGRRREVGGEEGSLEVERQRKATLGPPPLNLKEDRVTVLVIRAPYKNSLKKKSIFF